MMRLALSALLAVVAVPVLFAAAVLALLGGAASTASAGGGRDLGGSPASGVTAGGGGVPATLGGIPSPMLALYEKAARTCPGLPWEVLAGIGTVESDNGTSDLPGVHSGSNYAGAEGPMQFLPATFAAYDLPVPPGGANPPSPYDPTDAVYAAARDLCANGALHGADIHGAVFAYNHSDAYVSDVLGWAAHYAAEARARALGRGR